MCIIKENKVKKLKHVFNSDRIKSDRYKYVYEHNVNNKYQNLIVL